MRFARVGRLRGAVGLRGQGGWGGSVRCACGARGVWRGHDESGVALVALTLLPAICCIWDGGEGGGCQRENPETGGATLTCGLPSASAEMTRHSAESDVLILQASSSVSPVAPVLPTFSDPARSATLSLETRTAPSGPCCRSVSVSRAWDLDDCAFIRVEPIMRLALPHSRTSSTSASHVTYTYERGRAASTNAETQGSTDEKACIDK
eukprot:scaffold15978_cov103-Isochrysis_galbana.AAC.4